MHPSVFGVLMLIALQASAHAAVDKPYVVIVNAANTVGSLSEAELARLFLLRERQWQSGEQVLPVDQGMNCAVRQQFSTSVLGQDALLIKRYFTKMIFAGNQLPPVELSSDSGVIEFVSAHPGAIGYISAETAVAAGVKVLQVVD